MAGIRMTEEEAKTKWCPFARAISSSRDRIEDTPTGQAAFNIILGPNASEVRIPCIGSACMAWRATGYLRIFDGRVLGDDEMVLNAGDRLKEIPKGFCGLAGKP